jgi:hypothetical protein
LERGDVIALGLLVQLSAEFPRRNELRRYFLVARVRQNPRALDIAQHDANLRRNFPGVYGVGDRGKVRAFAGAENAESKWLVHGD